MGVHDFLERQRDIIVREWELEARQTAAGRLSPPALIDHLPRLLDHFVAWLRSDDPTPREQIFENVFAHAEQRLGYDLDVRQVVTEYRILRQVIFRQLIASNLQDDLPELARMNDALDAAITESVERYTTERDRELRIRDERLRLAVESAGVGTWDYSPPTGELYWSARCKELFGLPSDAPVSKDSFRAALHPDDRDHVVEAVRRSLEVNSGGGFAAEFRTVGVADDAERWVASRGQAFFDPTGRASRLIGTVVDITERKRFDIARAQFLGVLGHDLRNPLHTIGMATAQLARPRLDEERRRQLAERAQRSAQRMERLIRDVIDYTRGQLGLRLPLHVVPTDFDAICREVIDELVGSHPERVIDYRPGENPAGVWDPDRLAQILSNLLGNALKYSPPRSPVRLIWRREAKKSPTSELLLEVHNAGAPIPAELLPSVFLPFRSGQQSQEMATKSVGLGLFIVREIVTAHGGSVGVRSTGEEGTTFWVRLPGRAVGAGAATG